MVILLGDGWFGGLEAHLPIVIPAQAGIHLEGLR
jgi:hypothetical protein